MYLVTGASGFIGKHVLDSLTKRGETIDCTVVRGPTKEPSSTAERLPRRSSNIHTA